MQDQDKGKDLVGKAASKMTEVASQALAMAARQRRIDAERRALADLRAQALQLRAQIGEEMFKLWQTRTLPPSSLDHLFAAVETTMAEIAAQNERIERMLAPQPNDAPASYTLSELGEDEDVVEVLPPPPLPAAEAQLLTAGENPCPTCGSANPPGHRFCMDCGARLG
ncbi:MAG TPA: zinc ribbon domain-containing protein [Chloroflexota bacterium]|nr:zinc ribbon domain-containing protein [Chloroflexota bacterium]